MPPLIKKTGNSVFERSMHIQIPLSTFKYESNDFRENETDEFFWVTHLEFFQRGAPKILLII